MEITTCENISKIELYKLFIDAYSDYIVNVSMEFEKFKKDFLDYHEIKMENSFLAYDGKKPVGFIFGSVNIYENLKTLRCASFAVLPSYRNKNIGQKLFEKHLQLGKDKKCDRLFLEFIKGNKAKKFYLKNKYKTKGKMYYYYLKKSSINKPEDFNVEFKRINIKKVNDLVNKNNIHINYQNHPVVIKHFSNQLNYKIMKGNNEIGFISFNKKGVLNILYLEENYRKKGNFHEVLYKIINNNKIQMLNFSVTEELNYFKIFEEIGFNKKDIIQYEMERKLDNKK